MPEATKDIRKVALWLGHADMRTTEIYLQVDPSEKLEAIETVRPLGLRRGRSKAPDDLITSLFANGDNFLDTGGCGTASQCHSDGKIR